MIEGPPPPTDHLEEHGEGVHHVRFVVDNLDRKHTGIKRAEFRTILSTPSGNLRAYVGPDEVLGHLLLELLQPGRR